MLSASSDLTRLAQLLSEDDFSNELVQLSGFEEDNLKYLTDFMGQIGVNSEEVLAQIQSKLSKDQIQTLATDPATYYGLAQTVLKNQRRDIK